MKKTCRDKIRRSNLAFMKRLLIIHLLMALAFTLLLTCARPAHAEAAKADDNPPAPDTPGITCPAGFSLVRLSDDLSGQVRFGVGVWITYPVTTGGLTCVEVRS